MVGIITGTKPTPWTLSPQMTAAPELWRDLVVLYPFWEYGSGQVRDLNWGRNHGTLTNMTPSMAWTRNRLGAALATDGNDDEVLIPGAPPLSQPAENNALTISVWIRNKSPGTGGKYILQYRSNEWNIIYGFNGNEYETFWSGGDIRHTIKSISNTDTDLHHLLVTYDVAKTDFRAYWDGVETLNITESTALNSQSGPSLSIGSSNGGGFFEGEFSSISVWSRSMTKSEAQLLYRNPFAMLHPVEF